MLIVTKELLEQGMSLNGAWNSAQLKALGVKTIYNNKGWKSRLIGSKVTQKQVNEFLRLTNRHLAHKTRMIPFEQPFEKAANSHMASIGRELKHSLT